MVYKQLFVQSTEGGGRERGTECSDRRKGEERIQNIVRVIEYCRCLDNYLIADIFFQSVKNEKYRLEKSAVVMNRIIERKLGVKRRRDALFEPYMYYRGKWEHKNKDICVVNRMIFNINNQLKNDSKWKFVEFEIESREDFKVTNGYIVSDAKLLLRNKWTKKEKYVLVEYDNGYDFNKCDRYDEMYLNDKLYELGEYLILFVAKDDVIKKHIERKCKKWGNSYGLNYKVATLEEVNLDIGKLI